MAYLYFINTGTACTLLEISRKHIIHFCAVCYNETDARLGNNIEFRIVDINNGGI